MGTQANPGAGLVPEVPWFCFSHDYSAVIYYSHTDPRKPDVVFYNGSEDDSFNETAESVKAFVKRYKLDGAVRLDELWKSVKVDPATLANIFEYV